MQSSQAAVSPQAPSNGSEWAALISTLNCSSQGYESSPSGDLECARAAPAETLVSIGEQLALAYRGTVDNVTVLAAPEAARLAGLAAPVPIMVGTNADEGSIFTASYTNTSLFFASLGFTPDQASQFASIYPLGSVFPPSGRVIANDSVQIESIFTDLAIECPAAIVSNDSSVNSVSPVPTWRYFYNATFPTIQPAPGTGIDWGVYHSAEIPLVFGTYDVFVQRANAYGAQSGGPTDQVASESEMRLSEHMQSAWATFARNPSGGPGWSSQNEENGYVEVLGGGWRAGTSEGEIVLAQPGDAMEIDGQRCQVWSLVYQAVAAGASA